MSETDSKSDTLQTHYLFPERSRCSTFGFLPLCTPEKGRPWFAGNVTIGYTAGDARVAFTKACTGNPDYQTRDWDALKKEGWRIVQVKIETA